MDNSAIVPETYAIDGEAIQETEKLAVAVAEDADKELASLKGSSGWNRIVKDMETDIALFKTGGFIKNIEKLPLDEVGKMFVIHQTVATLLQGYLNKVENAAKAVADAERNNQPRG